jgi:hypothetical protein
MILLDTISNQFPYISWALDKDGKPICTKTNARVVKLGELIEGVQKVEITENGPINCRNC